MRISLEGLRGSKCRIDGVGEHRFEKRRGMIDAVPVRIDEYLVGIEYEAEFGRPRTVGAQSVVGPFGEAIDGSPVHARVDVGERDAAFAACVEYAQFNSFGARGRDRIRSDACLVHGETGRRWWRGDSHAHIVSDIWRLPCF